MRIRTTAAFLAAFTLFFLHVQAFSAETTNPWNNVQDGAPRAARLAMAERLRNDISKITQFIPTMRPSEKEWLERERSQIKQISDVNARLQRIEQLQYSPENNQELLASILSNVIDAIDCVQQSKVTESHEMYCWSVASQNLINPTPISQSIEILMSAGRLPMNFPKLADMSIKDLGYAYSLSTRGMDIQRKIVTPYLYRTMK